MDKTISLEIISPEQIILKEEIKSLVCKTSIGEVGILPDHTSFLAYLIPGDVRITDISGKVKKINLQGSFMEVNSNHIIILVQ